MEGINETVLMIAVGVVFCSVVLCGSFAAHVASLWLKNRREERKLEIRVRELRNEDRLKEERQNWWRLTQQQAATIERLNGQIMELSRNYQINKALLAQADRVKKAS